MRDPKEVEKLSQEEVSERTRYLEQETKEICDRFCFAMRELVFLIVEQSKFQQEVDKLHLALYPKLFLEQIRGGYDFWVGLLYKGSNVVVDSKKVFAPLESIAETVMFVLSSKDIDEYSKRGSIETKSNESSISSYRSFTFRNRGLFNQFAALFNFEKYTAKNEGRSISCKNILESIEATRNTPCESISEHQEGSLQGYIIASQLRWVGENAFQCAVDNYLFYSSSFEDLVAGLWTMEVYRGLYE